MIELIKAVALVQAELPKPIKYVNNDFKNYKYADLATVIETVYPVTTKNNLIIVQPIIFEGGIEILHTKLYHISGLCLESQMPIGLYKTAQERGSAITYARRYAMLSILGLAPFEKDDDGSAASGHPAKTQVTYGAQALRSMRDEMIDTGQGKPRNMAPKLIKASVETLKEIQAILFEKGWTRDDISEHLKTTYKVSSGSELTKEQADELLDFALEGVSK